MLSVLKRISVFVAIPGMLLFTTSVPSQIAHAQSSPGDSAREAVLREVFGTKVIEGLNSLFADRFESARERAMDLAQKVEDHELSLMEARDSLFKLLVQMDRGESLISLSDPAFEVVGVIPRGEVAVGHDVPGALSPMIATAHHTESRESTVVPVSAVKKTSVMKSQKPDTKPDDE